MDRSFYVYANQWNFNALEVRCPATPPFWIQKFDPLRYDSDNAECLGHNVDLKSEMKKMTIPEGQCYGQLVKNMHKRTGS